MVAEMYLEVAPSGGKPGRSKYPFGAKERRISLGAYPEVSPKKARLRCPQARQLITHAGHHVAVALDVVAHFRCRGFIPLVHFQRVHRALQRAGKVLRRWANTTRPRARTGDPSAAGKPTDNTLIESFNGSLQDLMSQFAQVRRFDRCAEEIASLAARIQ